MLCRVPRAPAFGATEHAEKIDHERVRVVTRPVKIGRGALREALHVLWPLTPVVSNDDAVAND